MNNISNSEPIDPKVAKAMVAAYAKDGDTASECYTKAVWFPAHQILKMADEMREGKYDGLRIYFAQYLDEVLEGVPESYAGRNTLLLVPTIPTVGNGSNGDDEHKDDLKNIENRGSACPDMCEGTSL